MIRVIFADEKQMKKKDSNEVLTFLDVALADDETRKTTSLRVYEDKDGFLPDLKPNDVVELQGYINYKNEVGYHVKVVNINKEVKKNA